MEETPYLIPAFHGVREALIQGQIRIEELWIAEGKKSIRTREILKLARERNIPICLKKGTELSRILPDVNHQGVVALVKEFTYSELDHLANISFKKKG